MFTLYRIDYRTEITVLLCEQKRYPVWVSCRRTEKTPASFPVVLGDFGCDVTADVTCQAFRENSPSALGSKPPLVTRIARTGLGTRLEKP